MECDHTQFSRRQMLRSLLSGSIVMPAIFSQLLTSDGRAAELGDDNPLAPRQPHFAPKAKRIIFIYLPGGMSHVDSFDYKPRLFTDHNLPYQVPKKMLDAFAPNNRSEVKFFKRPSWEFKPRGQSGLWISELFPQVAECADDLCLVSHGDPVRPCAPGLEAGDACQRTCAARGQAPRRNVAPRASVGSKAAPIRE